MVSCSVACSFCDVFHQAGWMRYTLEIEKSSTPYLRIHYADLDSDLVSEVITSVKGASYYFLTVKTNELRIYDQWNLEDSLDPAISGIFTGNYDEDSFSEIYVFSHKNDSLFLNINEILDKDGVKSGHIYITKIGTFRGKVESFLFPAGFFDKNGDGLKELFFSISSGFNLGPRKMYSYDIQNDSIDFSTETSVITLYPGMADADNDSRPEIFGRFSASGNFNSNVPFSDSSTWLMVFNDDLDFEFPPVEFKGFANGLYIAPFNRNYAVLHWQGGADTSVIASRIMLYATEVRFGERFNYSIEVGEGITRREKVPKLVLHTFAENAIKHGIIPKSEGGVISIRINKDHDYISIIIEDNGIGRDSAMTNQQISTGKGLKLTREFYDILNRMNTNTVSYTISDLFDPEGKAAGTRVEILVPSELGIISD